MFSFWAFACGHIEEKDIIRMEAQQLIVSALEDGTLEKILSTVLKDWVLKRRVCVCVALRVQEFNF